ncbi:MAG: glutamate synthase domain-containing protein 2 [Parvibaculaceae bacterium]|jgi:glutamate synthase domain-containing protein 2|nr:FMN-binding glutamate synthase family protein [Parvibaculaceae bacterium]
MDLEPILQIVDHPITLKVLDYLTGLFILSIGALFLTLIALYIIDRTQTKHAIRRNYPVIGRFRYLFESLGEYFRQYFFAMDREELPFNRAQRAWIYRAAKGIDTTVAFGSTRDLRPVGTVSFVNCPFATLEEDSTSPSPLEIGPTCKTPFNARSIYNISGMSYGALSKPAITALAKGAARSGCWINTGEGGLSPFHMTDKPDIVFQIGTAKYGVRDDKGGLSDKKLQNLAALDNVRMFEFKLSQGAKPGKGGMLPGAKVSKEIAEIRGIPIGQDSLSPNRHPDINSLDELLDSVKHVREVTGKPVGFKFVLGDGAWLEDLFTAICARPLDEAPDFLTIDSADGGTGAAPQPLIDFMGMPIWESLPLLVDARDGAGLRDRIRIIASGKMINPGDVAWALTVGADFVVSGRGFLFSLGCIQALQCNKNTCPTGITTHNKRLQRGLDIKDKAERVAKYQKRVVKEVCMISQSCGLNEPHELNRTHARILTANGISVRLDDYYARWSRGELASVDPRTAAITPTNSSFPIQP